jgi:hypothetical protein
LFEIANDQEIKVIYEENTGGMPIETWLEMYKHAVKEPYSFLYMNFKNPKHLRFMKRFDKYLFFQSDSDVSDKEDDKSNTTKFIKK